jgi:hypothetical protein
MTTAKEKAEADKERYREEGFENMTDGIAQDDELAKLLDQPAAKGWLPKPGDKVTGIVVDVDTATSEYGEYPLIEVQRPDGSTVAVHAFHEVLKKRIASKKPKIGDRIGIVYFGKDEGGKYGGFENYKVVVMPPEAK